MTRHPSGVVKKRVQAHAAAYAAHKGLQAHTTASGVVIFKPGDNFHPAAFEQITRKSDWQKRAAKGHSHRRSFPTAFAQAAEMDSCNSSDALLMNLFCHPQFPVDKAKFKADTGILWFPPRFGVSAKLPVVSGGENTQLDMVLGTSHGAPIFEAKLTEADFTEKSARIVERYNDLETVFDVADLHRTGVGRHFCDYQLIRNVLAAHHRGAPFFLLIDRQRDDLADRFDALLGRVRDDRLRQNLRRVTWQQLARHAPSDLRSFLSMKYGIGVT